MPACPSPRPSSEVSWRPSWRPGPRREPGRSASPSRFQDIEARRGNQEAELTAATFDQQVASKLQPFYGSVFLPTMKQLVDALTDDQVKNILEVPPAIGAKITAKQFEERTAAY